MLCSRRYQQGVFIEFWKTISKWESQNKRLDFDHHDPNNIFSAYSALFHIYQDWMHSLRGKSRTDWRTSIFEKQCLTVQTCLQFAREVLTEFWLLCVFGGHCICRVWSWGWGWSRTNRQADKRTKWMINQGTLLASRIVRSRSRCLCLMHSYVLRQCWTVPHFPIRYLSSVVLVASSRIVNGRVSHLTPINRNVIFELNENRLTGGYQYLSHIKYTLPPNGRHCLVRFAMRIETVFLWLRLKAHLTAGNNVRHQRLMTSDGSSWKTPSMAFSDSIFSKSFSLSFPWQTERTTAGNIICCWRHFWFLSSSFLLRLALPSIIVNS